MAPAYISKDKERDNAPYTQMWGTKFNPSICERSKESVINASMIVMNVADSKLADTGASDQTLKLIQVWPLEEEGAYCALVLYSGLFDAFEGYSSQSEVKAINVATRSNNYGKFEAGYAGIIKGKLLSLPRWMTKGYLGIVSYACNPAGFCPGQKKAEWIPAYFEKDATFTYIWWGLVYTANNNRREF